MEGFLKSCVGHCILAFLIGFGIGLIFLIISKIRSAFTKRDFKTEIKKLKSKIDDLHKIIVDSGVSYSSKLDELKKKNDTMKKTINILDRKPNRKELKTLYLYDKAIHIMYSKVPSFSTIWEDALKDAEKEMGKNESGKKRLFEKIFHPSLFNDSADETDNNQNNNTDSI